MSNSPIVSLVTQPDYDPSTLKDSIVKMLEPLGGMKAFVKRGDNVILKPNFVRACAEGVPAHTSPEVFRAVAELVLAEGALVKAGDSPGLGSAHSVAKNCGILPIAQELGIDIIEFTPKEIFDENRQFKKLTLSKELLEADAVINLPRMKTHGQMLLTAATKNLFGAVLGAKKFEWHYRAGEDKIAFARMIYEICMAVKPDLHILDAVVSMDGMGPTAGKANSTCFMAAGVDPVAIDATLMRILGRQPEELYTIAAATEAGDTAWKNTQIIGERIEDLKPDKWHWPVSCSLGMINNPLFDRFPILDKWFRHFAAVYPYVIPSKCVKCKKCIEICPAKAMRLEENVEIDYEKCIRCFCCHELCPKDALGTRGGLFSKVLNVFSSR